MSHWRDDQTTRAPAPAHHREIHRWSRWMSFYFDFCSSELSDITQGQRLHAKSLWPWERRHTSQQNRKEKWKLWIFLRTWSWPFCCHVEQGPVNARQRENREKMPPSPGLTLILSDKRTRGWSGVTYRSIIFRSLIETWSLIFTWSASVIWMDNEVKVWMKSSEKDLIAGKDISLCRVLNIKWQVQLCPESKITRRRENDSSVLRKPYMSMK